MRIKTIVCSLMMLYVFASYTCAQSVTEISIALIADKASGLDKSPLVPLFEVELSKIENIKLLERSEIDKILTEQKLQLTFESSENKSRMHIGNILGADVLIVIENALNTKTQSIRLRIVETRTGIILGDFLQTDSNITDNIQAFVEYTRSTLNKTIVPIETRQYIGILGFESEEPGSELNSLASIVTALVSSNLNRSANFVVLEREQLSYIIKEHNLAGTELDLSGSTVILRGGIRRNKNSNGLIVTLSFASIVNQQTKSTSIEVQKNDSLSVSREILNTIYTSLDTKEANQENTSHELEAKIFAIRAEELMNNDNLDQAIAFAEAALALNSTVNYREVLYECCYLKWNNPHLPLIDRLQACKRGNEVDLETVKQIARTGIKSPSYNIFHIFGLNTGFNIGPNQQQERKILLEIKSICLEKYEILHELYKNNSRYFTGLLTEKIVHISWFSESSDSVCMEIESLITEFVNIPKNSTRPEDVGEKKYFLERLAQFCSRYLHREYNTQIFQTMEWVSKHQDPLISVIGYSCLSYLDGQEGIDAAKNTLDLMFFKIDDNLEVWGTAIQAIVKLKQEGIMESYFENILEKAEKESNSAFLMNNVDCIFYLLDYADKNQRAEWSKRILSLTEFYPIKDHQKQSYEKYKRTLSLNVSPIPESSNSEKGLWANYDITTIAIPNRDSQKHKRLIWVQVDKYSQEITLVWRSSQKKQEGNIGWYDYFFSRMDIQGSKMYQVGQMENLQDFSIICSTDSPDYVFFSSKGRGLIVAGHKGIETFSESEGCPSNNIKTMAWLDGYLYLGFDGCLAKYDPQSRNFEIIASSKSVEKKNPLDGDQFFEFYAMLSDPKRKNLWFSLRDWSSLLISDLDYRRLGIWKYNPKSQEYTHVSNYYAPKNMNLNDRGEITLELMEPYIINPDTDKIMLLSNYSEEALRKMSVMIGTHIINLGGMLYSDDGKKYKLGLYWNMLDLFGSGFIAANYGDNVSLLYFVKPKNKDK